MTEMKKRRLAYMWYVQFPHRQNQVKRWNKTKIKNANQHVFIRLGGGFCWWVSNFSILYDKDKTLLKMLRSHIEDKLTSSFPNVDIAFRIYLSILKIVYHLLLFWVLKVNWKKVWNLNVDDCVILVYSLVRMVPHISIIKCGCTEEK